jgi:tRNA nucleotidyltransferase (CCA-adding enzyme)
LKLRLPGKVQRIINVLYQHGYEAYAVGGCVRDSVLMREPHDWDITTSATPEQVKELFDKTLDTGLEHGTVTIMIGREGFEVTTYRIDGEYLDGRHPKEVVFTPKLEEDLKRRDFTINAMAYSEHDGLVDRFGGMMDLQNRIIRCVGNPEERFSEDALRMLRAVRFSAQLGFSIDEDTRQAIKKLAPALKKISAERIQAELIKLLTSNHPEYFQEAYELGITKVILPEFDVCMECEQKNPHHMYTVGEHLIKSMTFIKRDKALRFTMLLHDIGKPKMKTTDEAGVDHFHKHASASCLMAEEILKRLKFDNDTIRTVTTLVRWHDYHPEPKAPQVRKLIHKVGQEYFPLLMEVQRADLLAQSGYQLEEKARNWERVGLTFDHILNEEQCISLKQLAVNGKDLIDLGMKPGKQVGETLEMLLNMVLEYPQCNTKMYLVAYVQEHVLSPDLPTDKAEGEIESKTE